MAKKNQDYFTRFPYQYDEAYFKFDGYGTSYPIIRTSVNYNRLPRLSDGEYTNKPSKTVPDMAMTPEEILLRFRQGKPLTKSNNLVFTGDAFTPEVRKMDLTELFDMKAANEERLQKLHDEIEDKKRLRKQAKDEQMKLKAEAELRQKVIDEMRAKRSINNDKS